MIIQCQSCSRKFVVEDSNIPSKGRTVQCGYCSVVWHQMPLNKKNNKVSRTSEIKPTETSKPSTVNNIKASDGKTYKLLGNQWAELFSSGKTGLFAKKNISRELNKITGRKEEKTAKKRNKKKINEVNPSSLNFKSSKHLPKVYEPNKGIGFLGYVFLFIIVGLSIVGVLKTFENDLLVLFPKMEYIYELLDEQLIFFIETVKNMTVIITDLLNSY